MLIIDVGANQGDFVNHVLCISQENQVVALEPNPLHSDSLKNIQNNFSDRFMALELALGPIDGQTELFGASSQGGQLASTLRFNPRFSNPVKILDTAQKSIMCNEMSVQRFVSNYGLQAIDFLKIDTQGTDLFILHEFLKHATVKAGVVEVYSSEIESEQMYLESRNTFRELCRILDSMGRYKIQKVIPAESTCKELNVFFFNCAYTNAENIISILQIEKSPTFGKFWQILGVGFGKTTAKPLPKIFARKILIGMRTPKKSLKSLLRRITA